MTFGYLLALAWRRRFVTAVCLVLTGVALFLGSSPIESWNGRVSVVLLAPESARGTRSRQRQDLSSRLRESSRVT